MQTPSVTPHPHVLREYALLADGERGAMVGPRGDVAWLCFPGWDGDPVFASLLGAPSYYAVHPVGPAVWGGYYETGTLIWRSRWLSGGSIVECREALAFPGERGRAVLLRRIEAVRGPSRVEVRLHPGTGWGRFPLRLSRAGGDGGSWTAAADGLRLRWSGAGDARPEGAGVALCLDLEQGARHDLVLELDGAPLDGPPADPGRLWKATEAAWHEAVPQMWTAATRDARHAYAVLRGLTTIDGGMVACATTSLPERATQGGDYDYRYVWIRDQSYAGQAAATVEGWPLVDAAVRFTTERLLADGPRLRPAYRSDGSPLPDDVEIDLPGYPGGPEVHSGNRAGAQFQLDGLGEALLLLATAATCDRVDAASWRAATVAADAVAQRWREPDAGVWEIDDRHWTHSRLVCAAGLRRIAAAPGAPAHRVEQWGSLADALVDDATAHCVHASGRWQRAPDDERVDAALLLPAIRGAISAADPRTLATIEAVQRELSREFFVYRYRHHDAGELQDGEGAFLLCGFWMSLATLQQGDVVGAVRWFERARTACGPPGLLSEEYDVRQRQLRGNLPQAFVHALLLECAARLAPHVGEER